MNREEAFAEVETSRFGKIRVPQSNVLHFEGGLLAFEHCKRFVLIRLPDQEPFQWIQSLDDGELAFVLLDPCLLEPAYRAELRPAQVGRLWNESAERMIVFVIATIPADPRQATANLAGPLIIDAESREGVQIVLNADRWQTRHPVFRPAGEGDNGNGLEEAA